MCLLNVPRTLDSVGHDISTVNVQLATTQISGILIRLSEISKKMYHFYEVTQKQIWDVPVFSCYVVSSHPPLGALPVVFLDAGAITVIEAS
jgi:hypothetical protein